ncbi:MAG: hypothetical protein K2H16_10825, partial [Prevotella sp.]|nr:hypothetical protein [Prevotella sp.]
MAGVSRRCGRTTVRPYTVSNTLTEGNKQPYNHITAYNTQTDNLTTNVGTYRGASDMRETH